MNIQYDMCIEHTTWHVHLITVAVKCNHTFYVFPTLPHKWHVLSGKKII